MSWIALLAGLLLLGGTRAAAQTVPKGYVLDTWTTADGLPVNGLTDVVQTRDGYLWVASWDGLIRFDGIRFTVYNRSNAPGLPSNRLFELYETSDGRLWIRTENNQLAWFKDGEITSVGPADGLAGAEVTSLFAGQDSTMLAATHRGIFSWDGTGFVERWRLPETISKEPSGVSVAALLIDSRGVLWIGTLGAGLLRVTGERTDVLTAVGGTPLAAISGVAEDDSGRIWVSAYPWQSNMQQANARGLFTVEGDSLQWRPFGAPSGGQTWPSGARMMWQDKTRAVVSFAGLLFNLFEPLPNDVWQDRVWGVPTIIPQAGTGPRSILGMDLVYRPDGFVVDSVRYPLGAFWDAEGGLWVASNGAGLWHYRPTSFETLETVDRVSLANQYPVLVDRRNLVWTADQTFAGVKVFDRAQPGSMRSLLVGETVLSIYEDRGGAIWIGTNTGFCRIPPERLQPLRVASNDCEWMDLPGMDAAPIYATYQDREGGLWIASDRHVWRLVDGDWQEKSSVYEASTTMLSGNSDLSRRPSPFRTVVRSARQDRARPERIRVITESSDGTLWFGFASGGLSAFVPDVNEGYDGGTFFRLTKANGLTSDSIRDLYADEAGFVWVVTEDAGLLRIDLREADTPDQAKIVAVRQQDGLPEDALHGIQPDASGRFWISSNRGLFWVDRTELNAFIESGSGRIRTALFTERDGLVNKEFNGGFSPSSARGPDGRLWFPNQAGLVTFNPEEVVSTKPPSTVIEGVVSRGVSHAASQALVLNAEDRSFDVTYTAVSFTVPEAIRFRYRLEGYNKDWVEASDRRTAYYTKVPAGSYRFLVSAAGKDGVWHEQPSSLSITVRPFFYETLWFMGLCALLFVGLLVAGTRLRIRQLNARQRLLEAVVADRTREVVSEKSRAETALQTVAAQAEQLRALDAAKSRFFANISHEFRTPLTLILGPVRQLLETTDVAPEVRAPLGLVQRNAHRLHHLINQLLDLARIDAGGLVLRASPQDIVAYTREIVSMFESLARLRGIYLRFDSTEASLEWTFDEEKIEKVLMNLVSNALKFTPVGGSVSVQIERTSDRWIRLTVEDTGIGVAAEHLPHLFDRFYQVDTSSTRRREGSGIGLALAHDLVILHGGRLTVDSTEGEGARFVVLLPQGEAAVPNRPDERQPDSLRTLQEGVGIEGDTEDPGSQFPADEVERSNQLPLALVVEDNADLRSFVRSILDSEFQVIEATDGDQGLEIAIARVPDIVVSDVMMPGMDGFALCRAIKSDARTSHVPVVLLTARDDVPSRLDGLGMGADDYLTKPFNPDELRLRLRNLTEQRRMLRSRFGQEVMVLGAEEVTLPSREVDFLGRVKAAVNENLSDPDFGVDRLAEWLDMSRSQLERKLSALVGEMPGTLIRRIRLERAALLLRQGGAQVKTVAASVGYRSMPHFSEAFRQTYGVSPSAFPEPSPER